MTSAIRRAVLHVSGLGQYEFRISGAREVGNSELTPGWSDYRKTVYYDSYDVTSVLRIGDNALEDTAWKRDVSRAGDARRIGTKNFLVRLERSSASQVQLEIEYTNGHECYGPER